MWFHAPLQAGRLVIFASWIPFNIKPLSYIHHHHTLLLTNANASSQNSLCGALNPRPRGSSIISQLCALHLKLCWGMITWLDNTWFWQWFDNQKRFIPLSGLFKAKLWMCAALSLWWDLKKTKQTLFIKILFNLNQIWFKSIFCMKFIAYWSLYIDFERYEVFMLFSANTHRVVRPIKAITVLN